ncbi:MAG: Gfo/Idh/MocA family protein [Rhizobiaceae bacterium]
MDKTVRIGLIGTSWWVDLMYVPSLLSHPAARVVGVCGRDASRAGEVARKLGAKVFADYRELVASGEIDAIVVAAPDDLHYEMTVAAIEAGLHVLCEKPLAGKASQARDMLERAERARVKHMVLFTWRWQPHWRFVKQLVDDGFLGRCYHATFEFLATFALDDGYKWRFDGRRSNGVAGDLGSHLIDFAQWFLGDVCSVSADLPRFIDQSTTSHPSPMPVNDVGLLTIEFVGGARAQIRTSAVSRLGDEGVRVSAFLHGEEGTLEICHTYFGVNAGVVIRGVRKGERMFSGLEIPVSFYEGGVDPQQLFDPYIKQSAGPRAFIDAILADMPAAPGFDVGVRVQEVVDAALQSNAEKRCVRLATCQA